MNKHKVMIVDDSLFYRNFLQSAISSFCDFQIVATAVSAEDAKNKIEIYKPDILTLDIEMPGISGIEFLKELMKVHPIPVILISSLDIRIFDALKAGAIDYIKKFDRRYDNKDTYLSRLHYTLQTAASAKISSTKRLPSRPTAVNRLSLNSNNDVIIAIGASTGGTEAILSVVRDLPANTPPIVITQHMPAGFTKMYADRLNKLCKMNVREAKNGDLLEKGTILIAPGKYQMSIIKSGNSYKVQVKPGKKVNGHAPSVDVLFNSVAEYAPGKAIAVILTGMGSDGAKGLLNIRNTSSFTIGQDRNTSVVYGMPMEAYRIGAVCKQAALYNIPDIILDRIKRMNR